MKVRELINRLKEFNEEAEIAIQYYNPDSLCQQELPASNDRDIYDDEDEDGPRTDRVIFDIWTFSY